MTGTYAAAVQRNLIGRVLATVGAMVAVVGTFMPWLRSGTRDRNSYEIFSLVDRLGISQSSLVGWGVRLWPIVPFLLVLTVSLLWIAPRAPAVAVAAITVVFAGGVSIAVYRAPARSLVAIENGPVVTFCGLALLTAGVVLSCARNRAIREPDGGSPGGRS
jgi:hypothetical protein